MKKLFLVSAIALVALCFASCKDSSEPRCWKVTYKIGDTEMVTYQWLSEDMVNATYGKLTDFKATKVSGAAEDCVDKNLGSL